MTDSRDIQAELDAANWAIDGYEREREQLRVAISAAIPVITALVSATKTVVAPFMPNMDVTR